MKTTMVLRLRPQRFSARLGYSRVQGTHRDDPEAGRLPEEGRRRRTAAAEVERGHDARVELRPNRRELEHPRGSTSTLVRAGKPENGRSGPATKSSGGAMSFTGEGSLGSKPTRVGATGMEMESRVCSLWKESSWSSLEKKGRRDWRRRPELGKKHARGNQVAISSN